MRRGRRKPLRPRRPNRKRARGPRVSRREAGALPYGARIRAPRGGRRDEEKPASDNRTRHVRTAVLAVPDADTTKVMLGASLGELRLALRGQGETEAGAGTETA